MDEDFTPGAFFPEQQRPPSGVMPRALWLEARACDLARAIHEHLQRGHQELVPAWVSELQQVLAERKRCG